MKRAVAFVLVSLTLAAVLPLLDARTRLMIFEPNGYAQTGKALGIRIGQKTDIARSRLETRSMTCYAASNGGMCFFRRVPETKRLDIFHVDSFHGGTVCLVSENGQVAEVVWAFQPIDL